MTLADALSAHEDALSFGGLPGIVSLDLVESAIGRPYSGYYKPLWKKAGALAQSVAGNHGFTDGNKRTALLLLHILLDKSSYALQAIQNENIETAIEDLLVRIATHQVELDEIFEWFRTRVVRVKNH